MTDNERKKFDLLREFLEYVQESPLDANYEYNFHTLITGFLDELNEKYSQLKCLKCLK